MSTVRRNPDAAPHCTQCGYNLLGREDRRCPECGRVFETDEEWDAAKWSAPANATHRRIILVNAVQFAIGCILLITGICFAMFCDEFRHRPTRLVPWLFLLYMLFTIRYLYHRHSEGELMGPAALALGGVSGLIGVCLWW